MKKYNARKVAKLVKVCKSLYDDASDRGETHGDDGKEFWDWMEFREAIENLEGGIKR